MMSDYSPNKPRSKMKTKADIVFCIDRTGSMTPCIEGVKSSVMAFAEGLQTEAKVDFRLRLVAYRDLPSENEPIEANDFCAPGDQLTFQGQVGSLEADGGGPEPESTLDALYTAIQSDWRHPCHKAILVFTDAPCYRELYDSTIEKYGLGDGSPNRVIDAAAAKRTQLFIVAPDFDVYRTLEAQIPGARYEIAGDRGAGLAEFNFKEVMNIFSRSISVSSRAWPDDGDEDQL